MSMRRRVVGVTVGLLVAAGFAAGAPAPAVAQVPFAEADFGGSATGTFVHSDELQSGDTRVVNVDEAFSAAVVESTGLPAEPRLNEMQRPYLPGDVGGARTFARGSGLEVGLVTEPDGEPTITQAGVARAKAGPNSEDSGLQVEEVGPVPAEPAAYASLLRGEAQARWSASDCILGADLSRGTGSAAHTQILDTDGAADDDPVLENPLLTTSADDPLRVAASSTSRLALAAQTNGTDNTLVGTNFGLLAQTRQTLAPITVFKGVEGQEFTVELLGEWVLSAVAGGLPGTAFVHYGPGDASPDTPIARIIRTGEETRILTLQDILGDEGLVIAIPGVAEIAIGEDPRAIGGDADSAPVVAADGTSAAAAVDVVRIKLLERLDDSGQVTQRAADIRVGHMEVQARVPAGGLTCDLDVAKSADKDVVNPGESFTYTVTVRNPYDCTLTDVRVEDTITVPPAVKFSITSTTPTADTVEERRLVWNDVGPIEPGGSKDLLVGISIAADSGAGRFENVAEATANCGVDTGRGGAQVNVPLEGRARVEVPRVQPLPGELPATGLPGVAGLGLVALGGGLALRRLRRSQPLG